MLLRDLVQVSRAVGETTRRTEKIARLAECLGRLEPSEIRIGVSYLCGRLSQGRIGLGGATIEAAWPGAAAEESRLSLLEVNRVFDRIAAVRGAGASRERVELFRELLREATREEQDFLVRLALGELRQGALEGLLLEAIARASRASVGDLRRALTLAGNLEAVAEAVLTHGPAGLDRFRLGLFQPLRPMLAQAAADLEEALARQPETALEYKLDGARIQVHKLGRDVRVFSRRSNDVTAAVPEIVEAVRELAARSLVLDGEALVLRPGGMPEPFQVTMRRFGRKLDVETMRQSLPLTPFFFDALHVDGEDLLGRPAAERWRALAAVARGLEIPRRLVTDAQQAREFFREALERGHEGVMAKDPRAPYEAGSRGFAWLKVKPARTADLVVLAAEWGHGRRTGWLSNLHLGARDPQTGGFAMVGKTFKGLTDELLRWQTARLREIAVATDGHVVHVRPELVVEVAFSDVQRSPHYPSGLALRFARVRRYREDKRPEEADTVESLRRWLPTETAEQGRS
ncbi:MAG: putative DNA ligase [Candidatus Binatia bacterium]|nr:MAG: putative DNA ligase [Candidatus Binatia bacterium]